MNNNIIKLQEILMKEMERLDDNNKMENDAYEEIERSKAISGTASAYLKSVSTNIKVMETAEKYKINNSDLEKKLGLLDE